MSLRLSRLLEEFVPEQPDTVTGGMPAPIGARSLGELPAGLKDLLHRRQIKAATAAEMADFYQNVRFSGMETAFVKVAEDAAKEANLDFEQLKSLFAFETRMYYHLYEEGAFGVDAYWRAWFLPARPEPCNCPECAIERQVEQTKRSLGAVMAEAGLELHVLGMGPGGPIPEFGFGQIPTPDEVFDMFFAQRFADRYSMEGTGPEFPGRRRGDW